MICSFSQFLESSKILRPRLIHIVVLDLTHVVIVYTIVLSFTLSLRRDGVVSMAVLKNLIQPCVLTSVAEMEGTFDYFTILLPQSVMKMFQSH